MQIPNRRHGDLRRDYALVPNGTRAAQMCGYRIRTARQQARHLLRRPDITARVAELGADPAEQKCAAVGQERCAA